MTSLDSSGSGLADAQGDGGGLDVAARRPARVEIAERGGVLTITGSGNWTVSALVAADAQLRALKPKGREAVFDLAGVERLDTAGVWLIDRTRDALEAEGLTVSITGLDRHKQALLERLSNVYEECETEKKTGNAFVNSVAGLGRMVAGVVAEVGDLLAFSGRILEAFFRVLINPTRLRFTSFVWHLEMAALNAVPIIALMSFLIGAVLAYLGASILQTFGAETFAVNLISFAFLREFGVLLTAIMVAGRSGSAFTAEIGSMKGHEEIDAMRTLGLDPIEVLVLPRVMALLIALPILTFVANIMGLLGGGVVSWAALDITPGQYLVRLENVSEINNFWAGMIKAPFFAFLIAMIGCYQGMMVEGTAEAVGRRTTQSVVQAIFTVIVADAFFAIYFTEIGF